MFKKNENKADTQKILFIDECVLDAADLLQDLQPGYQVVRLSANLDPITQITHALSAHSFVHEITVLAHAQPGQINFSNSTLDLAALHNRDHEFTNWDQWLTTDAKICIYACSLASGEIGQEFIHTLKNLTGAEIASSSLPIGIVGEDQNWDLDQFTQSFEVLMPFSKHSTTNYAHTLQATGIILDDDVTENDETFTLKVTPTAAIAIGSDGATGTVAIMDSNVTGTDTISPVLNSSNLTSESIYFPVNRDIQLNFDEVVIAGSGNIILSNGSDTRTIDINDANQVTFTGSKVTVNPVDDLIQFTSYNIQMASGVITNAAGNAYAGINDPTTLNFTTIPIDTRNPTLLFSIPDDNSTHQVDQDIQLIFNEAVVVAGIGNIVISNGSDTRTIDINDTSQVTFNGSGQVPFDGSGDLVTINPTVDLMPNTTYNIQMASGVIIDAAGNAYAGINDPTTLNFTAISSDPLLVRSNPSDESDYLINNGIRLLFNEKVVAGSGNIIISNGSDTRTIDINDASQVTFDRFFNRVIINPAVELTLNTTYNIQMASGVITDTAGNAYAGISDPTTLNFTAISSDPLLIHSDPGDDSTHQVEDNIRLFFNEAIVAGSGNIIISNGSDTRTIDINDVSQVTSGRSSNLVTINPTVDLTPNTIYNIQMASGVITDTAGNAYAGISDSTTLNFTAISSDPLLVRSNPSDESIGFPIDNDILLFFNEKVVTGIGNIILSSGSDTRTIDINDVSQITFDGVVVAINPIMDLTPNTTYNIQMASGVIIDAAGNAYAGISDPTTLNFTAIPSNPLLVRSNPSDDSIGFRIDNTITLTFNEGVVAGIGNIILSNGSDTRAIDINDISQVTVSGIGMNIKPTVDLTPNTIYNIQMASGVITDTVGNAYAGISDPTTLNFTTISSDPLLAGSNPDDDSNHQVENDIRLFFDEKVVAGIGNIVISNGSDTRMIDINDASQVTIGFNHVIIDPTVDLTLNTTYNIQMASGVITDTAGNAYAGINDPTTLNFRVIPSDPLLDFSNPLDDSTHQVKHDIRLFFNEKVAAGIGNIVISNGSDTRTIDINDISQVTFDNTIVTINPTVDFTPNTTYNIQMASGVITDTVGNAYAGISDPTTLNFTAIPTLNVNAGEDVSLDEGNTLTRTITFSDVEDTHADGWTYSVNFGDGSTLETGSIAAGIDSFDINHTYTDGDANHDVSVTVTDVVGDADTKGFAVIVNNVVPTIALVGAPEVNTDTSYTLNLGAVTDPGDDAVTSYIVDWGDGSSDAFNTAGDVTHTYAAAGNNTIRVDLVDEDGTHTVAGTQELTVIGNNPPVAQDDTFATDENVAVSGNLLADNGSGVDSDADGDPLSVHATTFETAADGTVNINTDGTFDYTPLLNFSGVDSFEYTLLDNQGNDDIGSVSITINEPPMNEIIGTTGRDILTGTSVNDLIKSLSGNVDRMTGGEGGDIFVFGAETTNGVRERDIILDYEVGIDAIQLEDGATVGSIRQTSSGVTVFFEGDRDAVYVRGEGVLVGNLTFIPEDIVLL